MEYYVFFNCKVLGRGLIKDRYIAQCDELECTLDIKINKDSIGKCIEMAIKSKDIEILSSKNFLKKENVIIATVEDIYELKGLFHIILNPVGASEFKIRIVKNSANMKLNDEIRIHLDPELMFEI